MPLFSHVIRDPRAFFYSLLPTTELLEGDRVIVIASEDALGRIQPASRANV
ncbi:MAG: hypothetical protein IIB85_01835 [Chloroflexi bacterium]|nr:hypothetical protein [Chloroflexota bacterium]